MTIMPVLLANDHAKIAAQAIKYRMFLEQNQYKINKSNSHINIYNSQLVDEKTTMSSKSSSTSGTKFILSKEAANETATSTVPFLQQEHQQIQLLLLQQQQQHFLLQHFAFAGGNNIPQLGTSYQIPPPPSPTPATTTSSATTTTMQYFPQFLSNITPQHQHCIQQVYTNLYGNMVPQQFNCSRKTTTVNALPSVGMEDLALTTSTPSPISIPKTKTKTTVNKPDIEALNDLTARIRQSSSSSMSLVALNTTSPQLTQAGSTFTTTTTTTTTTPIGGTSTLSLTVAPANSVLLAATKTTKSNNFNMSLDPQYQLQRHQQHEQKQQVPQTKQDYEKQTILLRHNETAHAIDSSNLPAATSDITETASSTPTTTTIEKAACEVAGIVLTVATPPVDTQTLPANCKGG